MFFFKWQVATSVLRIIHKLLQEYEISAENFLDQYLELQTGGKVSVNKPPGHTILTFLLNESQLLKMVCIRSILTSR